MIGSELFFKPNKISAKAKVVLECDKRRMIVYYPKTGAAEGEDRMKKEVFTDLPKGV